MGALVARKIKSELSEMQSLESKVRLTSEGEPVHDMRVSTRKLRACLRTFEEFLPLSWAAFQGELRWVAGSLGRVRDLDVFRQNLMRVGADCAPEIAEKLLAKVESEHRQAKKSLMRSLDSNRYKRLLVDFQKELAKPSQSWPDKSEQEAFEAGSAVLEQRYKSVKRGVAKLTPTATTDLYHKVRKRAKRLRYAADALGKLYGTPAKEFVAELKEFQDAFGNRQDSVTAELEIRQLMAGGTWSKADCLARENLLRAFQIREKDSREACLEAFGGLKKRWIPLKHQMKTKPT